jgi:hypothetical protein
VQSLSYTYDLLGNPLSRSDANANMSESFTHDGLNRLTSVTVNLSPAPLVKIFVGSAVGNMLLSRMSAPSSIRRPAHRCRMR